MTSPDPEPEGPIPGQEGLEKEVEAPSPEQDQFLWGV